MWLFEAYNAGEPDPQRRYQLIDFLDQPLTWRGLTQQQKMTLSGLYPGEAVWSGHNRAEWNPDGTLKKVWDPAYQSWKYFSGDEFCGGLEDTALEPERCTSKLGWQLSMSASWEDEGPTSNLTSKLNARYLVSITTAGLERAGTDAQILIKLTGDLDGIYTFVDSDPHPEILAPNGPLVGTFDAGIPT